MTVRTRETYENSVVEIIVDNNGTLCLNEKHIEKGLQHHNLLVVIRNWHSDYRKHRYELEDEPKKQPNRIFLPEDLPLTAIRDNRTQESVEFKIKLGLSVNVSNTKVQTVLGVI